MVVVVLLVDVADRCSVLQVVVVVVILDNARVVDVCFFLIGLAEVLEKDGFF